MALRSLLFFVTCPRCVTRMSYRLQSSSSATMSAKEINKFDSLASEWWDTNGPFKALHSFNEVRVPWIVSNLNSRLNVEDPLKGVRILEVGCGGGILTEPMARLGAEVTAIDLSAQSLAIAESRLEYPCNYAVRRNVSYQLVSLEEVAAAAGAPVPYDSDENTAADSYASSFDAIVMSEVIEHNDNKQQLLSLCGSLLKPDGKLFVTTLNKNPVSLVFGIIAAEYVLRIVPQGTHEFDKFVSPDSLRSMMHNSGLTVLQTDGLIYNPFCNRWSWSSLDTINYACVASKKTTHTVTSTDNNDR